MICLIINMPYVKCIVGGGANSDVKNLIKN